MAPPITGMVPSTPLTIAPAALTLMASAFRVVWVFSFITCTRPPVPYLCLAAPMAFIRLWNSFKPVLLAAVMLITLVVCRSAQGRATAG